MMHSYIVSKVSFLQKQALNIGFWMRVFYLEDDFRKCCEKEDERQKERKASIATLMNGLLWELVFNPAGGALRNCVEHNLGFTTEG